MALPRRRAASGSPPRHPDVPPDEERRELPEPGSSWRRGVQWGGTVGGPLFAVLAYHLLPGGAAGLSDAGRAAAAVGIWMAVWWLTEAVEVYVTALLPLALLPLTGIATPAEAAAPYAHELIFLFLGGFVLALSLQRWHLDQRIALITLRIVGSSPTRIVGGVMLATATMSMWVSNTATAAMMLPIALSIVRRIVGPGDPTTLPADRRNFVRSMLLGLAFAASIGGVGTIIGSPPNLLAASYLRENLGLDVGFVQWLAFGLPFVAVMLPATWLLLTRVVYPVGSLKTEQQPAFIRSAYRALGSPSRGEWVTFVVFTVTALAWVTRPLLAGVEVAGYRPLAGLSDATIAVLAAVALFLIPVDARRRSFVMEWKALRDLPWGVLILIGGGLSLATALETTGVTVQLGVLVSAAGSLPGVVFVVLVAAAVIFLTELTSNTATAAVLIPVVAAVAVGVGMAPSLLVVPVAMAASAAFMMPVATPPNAIIFGSGLISVPDLARPGLLLNLLSVLLVSAVTLTLVPVFVGG